MHSVLLFPFVRLLCGKFTTRYVSWMNYSSTKITIFIFLFWSLLRFVNINFSFTKKYLKQRADKDLTKTKFENFIRLLSMHRIIGTFVLFNWIFVKMKMNPNVTTFGILSIILRVFEDNRNEVVL